MIHEWVMGNGNSCINQSKVEFSRNVPMNNKQLDNGQWQFIQKKKTKV